MARLFVDQIRQLMREHFSRDNLNLTSHRTGTGEQGEVSKPNEAVAQRYVDLMSGLATEFGLA